MSTHILVTGGAGYIGSNVCKAVSSQGAIPVCYDSMEKGHEWAVRWGPLELGDIGDSTRLDEVFRKYRPTSVIHLAGYIEVGESVIWPARYLSNNAAKTDTLIAKCLQYKVQSFIFSSTCAVYGMPQTDLLSEAHPLAPLSPYADSKLRVESALTRAAAKGLRSVSLRYFNAAGADRDGEIGESHDPETHLMPLAADTALGYRSSLSVFGIDHPTPDGTCIRDFVHVIDLADAHLKAVAWVNGLTDGGCHEVFNLGSGTGCSVKELLVKMQVIGGRKVMHEVGPRRAGDSPKLVGDITKAKQILGWQPKRPIEVQIDDSLWWRARMPRQRQATRRRPQA